MQSANTRTGSSRGGGHLGQSRMAGAAEARHGKTTPRRLLIVQRIVQILQLLQPPLPCMWSVWIHLEGATDLHTPHASYRTPRPITSYFPPDEINCGIHDGPFIDTILCSTCFLKNWVASETNGPSNGLTGWVENIMNKWTNKLD